MTEDNIFTYLNAINYKKEVKYDKSIGNAYLLMLWLSHDKSLLSILNRINEHIFNLPDEIVFKYLFYDIPRGKRFLKWVKKNKTIQEENLEKDLEEYNLSKREIMLYSKFIK
jgi:hypothetical protein